MISLFSLPVTVLFVKPMCPSGFTFNLIVIHISCFINIGHQSAALLKTLIEQRAFVAVLQKTGSPGEEGGQEEEEQKTEEEKQKKTHKEA